MNNQIEIAGHKMIINPADKILSCLPKGHMKKGKIVKSVEKWVEENW